MDVTQGILIVFFVLGLTLFILGMYELLKSKETREERLIKSAAFLFIGNWILFLPVETLQAVGEKFSVFDVFEGFFSALIKNFAVYFGNGFDRTSVEQYPVFSDLYIILQLMISSLLLVIAAGVLIGFVDGPAQYIKMMFGKKKDIYVFGECNEKNLLIAESIYHKNLKNEKYTGKKRKILMIFSCGVDDISTTNKKKIKEMNGIFVKDSLGVILMRIKSSAPRLEVFLFSDEMTNLENTDEVLKTLKDDCSAEVRIFVELADSPWCVFNNILDRYGYDKKQQERVIINFIRDEESFVYNDLFRKSIFDHSIPSNDNLEITYDTTFENEINERRKQEQKEKYTPLIRKTDRSSLEIKDIYALIIGVNTVNIEMLKTLLHLGQMPGYRLNIAMIDKDDRLAEIKHAVRELQEDVDRYGDAVYHFRYEKNVDPFSLEFERLIFEKYPKFTFVFVNVGNDLDNVKIAMIMNALGYRLHRDGEYSLQTFVEKRSICDRWSPDLLRGIDLVGDLKERYDYDYIVLSDIENVTKKIHDVRYKGKRTWASYCNDEYNRHSVFARTLSFRYKVRVIDSEFQGDYTVVTLCPTWTCYEHMRWDMYTRTVGYDFDSYGLLTEDNRFDKKIRNLAKVHQDIRLYDDLEPDVKLQDGLELTDEIVRILKEEKETV